ncbi:MAG: RES domain-containing protein [Gammaproteobacteria bacterium]|nr:RES domain-containing protein [Gammaproteobacteria bacterium]
MALKKQRATAKVLALPRLAYRIGDARFPLFDGRGAMIEGGRWNSAGYPVIYCGLSQSGAMLEVLAQANIGKVPRGHRMIVIKIPATLTIETVVADDLPGWDHHDKISSRHFGDEWIISQRSVALIVPSVIAKHDSNIIINQMHPDFTKIKTAPPESIQWDHRLFDRS